MNESFVEMMKKLGFQTIQYWRSVDDLSFSDPDSSSTKEHIKVSFTGTFCLLELFGNLSFDLRNFLTLLPINM